MSNYKFEQIAINSTKKKKPIESDKNVYIGLEHLDSQSLEIKRFGSEVAPIGDKLIMKKGDVLFGKRRAYQKKVGIAPFDGIFSAHGMVLRPNEEVISKDFFPFFISSDYFLDKAIKISVGSLSPTINWKDLRSLEFSIPDLSIQSKYSRILWAMEGLKREYEKVIDLTKEIVQSQFVELSNSNDGIKEYKFSEIMEYLPKSLLNASDGYDDGEFPFFTSSNEQNKWTNDPIYDDECVIIGNGGVASIQYCNGKFSTGSHSYVVKSRHPDINTLYIYYYFQTNIDVLEEGFHGIAIKNITKEYINNLTLLIPKKNVQDMVIDRIRELDKSKFEIEEQIKQLEISKKALLLEIFGE